jgi:hypothetical protein
VKKQTGAKRRIHILLYLKIQHVKLNYNYYINFILIIFIKWYDNIKRDLQEMGMESMEWIDLTQERDRWLALVNDVMTLRIP